MDSKEILKFCIERGLLIEPEVLNILSEAVGDTESVKIIIEKIKTHTHKRIITKSLFEQNKERVSEFFLSLPNGNTGDLEKLKIKLGLQIEISKEVSSSNPLTVGASPSQETKSFQIVSGTRNEGGSEYITKETFEQEARVKISSRSVLPKKKIDVEDFTKTLRNRLQEIRPMLQEHSELENPVSINKLSKGKRVSIIGIVFEKRVTKNRNILFSVEDMTGTVKVLINQNKPDLYKKAEELALDSVVGFSGFGDKEIFFANAVVLPDSIIVERKKAPVEEQAAFIGDLQYGSKHFLKENFERFIHYLSEDGLNEETRKIKYLFIVGDLVSGVGVYPSQMKDLIVGDLEEQFKELASILRRVRKDIKIIISPGNHDGVRLMEPQPGLDEKYAWPIYSLPNVINTGNPCYVNIGATEDFSGLNVLTYHGVSYSYYANVVPSLIATGMGSPDKIMTYLLKHRHLAPTYSSVQALPSDRDELVIRRVPDVFVSGHLHKCAVSSYNNVLIIAVATWENETENQKKRGIKPDLCKVPILNLKTGAVKILDFE